MAALFLTLAVGLYAQLLLTADGLFTSAGPIIGGDYMVFNHAAKVAGTPDMLSIYEMKNLKAQLEAAYPERGDLNCAWMYPPTMSLAADAVRLATPILRASLFGSRSSAHAPVRRCVR